MELSLARADNRITYLSNIFYYIGIIAFFAESIILNSTYSVVLGDALTVVLKLFPLLLMVMSIATKSLLKYSYILLLLVCVACGLLSYRNSGSTTIITIVLLIFGALDLPIKYIAKYVQCTIVFTCIFVVISALLGVIPNIYRPGMYGFIPYDLGFGYGSQIGYCIESMLICQIIRTHGRLTNMQTVGYCAAALLYYLFWHFSSQFIIIIALLVICHIPFKTNYIVTKTKILLISLIFPIFGFGYLLFNYSYTSAIPWMNRLNQLLTWRLGLGYNALHNFGISIFGKKISFSGFGINGDTQIFSGAGGQQTIAGSGDYDYVDSSYLLAPLLFGLVCFGLILCAYSVILSTFYKLHYKTLVFVVLMIGLQCCINPILHQLVYNPILLFVIPFIQELQRRQSE